MAALIVGLVGLVATCIAWRAGYAVGHADGQDGSYSPWPWGGAK